MSATDEEFEAVKAHPIFRRAEVTAGRAYERTIKRYTVRWWAMEEREAKRHAAAVEAYENVRRAGERAASEASRVVEHRAFERALVAVRASGLAK